MTKYLTFRIHNDEPLRISDNSTSTMGETETLSYIPGSSLRGVVLNRLNNKGILDKYKSELMSDDVRFMNAYIMDKDDPLIPSPKGLYENKKIVPGRKELYNLIVRGNDMPKGMKRASVGEYAKIKGDTVYCYVVEKGSDLKVSVNPKNKSKDSLFRNEYMMLGNDFLGCIALPCDKYADVIKDALGNEVIIGNARSSGYGKCRISDVNCSDIFPFACYAEDKELNGKCYLMLMSNTAMKGDAGEHCGLNLGELEHVLGVKGLSIDICSTSTVDVCGFNKTLGIHVPAVKMYQYGSVFKLTFNGTITAEKVRELTERGIGIRKNEGFGQILFLKNYEMVTAREKGVLHSYDRAEDWPEKHSDDDETLKLVARNRYESLVDRAIMIRLLDAAAGHDLFGEMVSTSQLGVVQSIADQYIYQSVTGVNKIKELIDHAKEKESRKNQGNTLASVEKAIKHDILDHDLSEILVQDDVPNTVLGYSIRELYGEDYHKEECRIKLKLISALINASRKSESQRG